MAHSEIPSEIPLHVKLHPNFCCKIRLKPLIIKTTFLKGEIQVIVQKFPKLSRQFIVNDTQCDVLGKQGQGYEGFPVPIALRGVVPLYG